MSVVFDPLVFDIGVYDTTFQIPTLLDVWVEREFKKIALGQVVIIRARVVTLDEYNKKYLFNLGTPPSLTVIGPDGLVRVTNGGMVNVSLGVYQYRYQTGVSFDTTVFDATVFDTGAHDIPGVYTGYVQGREGNYDMHSLSVELFEVVTS